jgi:hypothetical protein
MDEQECLIQSQGFNYASFLLQSSLIIRQTNKEHKSQVFGMLLFFMQI